MGLGGRGWNVVEGEREGGRCGGEREVVEREGGGGEREGGGGKWWRERGRDVVEREWRERGREVVERGREGGGGKRETCAMTMSLFLPPALITEMILYSEGFESSKNLAQKTTQTYKLRSDQLSQQDHYDSESVCW